MKRHLYNTLDMLHLTHLTNVDDRHTNTGITGPACTTASVCVHFHIIGQFIVDHVRNTLLHQYPWLPHP